MTQYQKPYLSVTEQVELLRSRGMFIADANKAGEYLSRLGYYRLSAYWQPFRVSERDNFGNERLSDRFKEGTDFRWVTDLYAFDKTLRLLLLDVLERIEIFTRTAIALQLGKHDTHAHLDAQYLDRKFVVASGDNLRSKHAELCDRLASKVNSSKEEFAVHFRQKYPRSTMPIWIAVELLDFGPLSVFLSGMRWKDQKIIAEACGLPDPELLKSWIRALSVARNVCAHHARLWNKPLVDQPKLPKLGRVPLLDHLQTSPHRNSRVYAACAISRYLLLTVNPRTQWSTRLASHMGTFPQNPYVGINNMGFPQNWSELPLWQ